MLTDIIIPHYGTGPITDLCLRCLESIRTHTLQRYYRLIFVDNGSPEFDRISPELERHEGHLLIRNTTNVGFIKAVNQGIWMSRSDQVVLLNNDTEVASWWLEKLLDGFKLARNVGLVGPLMDVDKAPDDPIFNVSKPCWQSGWKIRNGGGPIILPKSAMVAFFCVMIDRAVIDKVGVLDEEFGVGFGDDDQYCLQAHQAGFEIVLQQDLAIRHHHRSTFRELYSPEQISAMQDQAMALFKAKCRS
jgi:GT2 family glycosyltransferase